MANIPNCCDGRLLRGTLYMGAEYNERGQLETQRVGGWNYNYGNIFGGSGVTMPASCIDASGTRYHLGSGLVKLGAANVTLSATLKEFSTTNVNNNLGGVLCERSEIDRIAIAGTVNCPNQSAYNLLLGLDQGTSTVQATGVADTIVIEGGTVFDADDSPRFLPFREVALAGSVVITGWGSLATLGSGVGGAPVQGTDFAFRQTKNNVTGIEWIKQGITSISADTVISVTYTQKGGVTTQNMFNRANTNLSLMFDGMYGDGSLIQLIIPRVSIKVSSLSIMSAEAQDMSFEGQVFGVNTPAQLAPIQLITAQV